MTIKGLRDKIQKVDVDQVIETSMEEVSPLMSDRQRGQMIEGVNKKGAKIGRYRNAAYARKKNQMNPIPGFGIPDLLLTGAFYRGIYTEVRGSRVIIDSTDEKAPKLVKQYGEEIFGLNKSTKVEFIREDLRPVFMREIKKATGL
jgi:hypothetical protein